MSRKILQLHWHRQAIGFFYCVQDGGISEQKWWTRAVKSRNVNVRSFLLRLMPRKVSVVSKLQCIVCICHLVLCCASLPLRFIEHMKVRYLCVWTPALGYCGTGSGWSQLSMWACQGSSGDCDIGARGLPRQLQGLQGQCSVLSYLYYIFIYIYHVLSMAGWQQHCEKAGSERGRAESRSRCSVQQVWPGRSLSVEDSPSK